MAIPLPPETIILERMLEIARGLDVHERFDLSKPITYRHFRHRHAASSEIPGVALRLTQSEIDNNRGKYHTSSEVCWAMDVDIVVDLDLIEEGEPGAPASDENDATGWDRLLGVARYIAGQYAKMDSPLRALVDDIEYGDVDPDEDTRPDKGRLAISVSVLYRTLSEDPLYLLTPEENAL